MRGQDSSEDQMCSNLRRIYYCSLHRKKHGEHRLLAKKSVGKGNLIIGADWSKFRPFIPFIQSPRVIQKKPIFEWILTVLVLVIFENCLFRLRCKGIFNIELCNIYSRHSDAYSKNLSCVCPRIFINFGFLFPFTRIKRMQWFFFSNTLSRNTITLYSWKARVERVIEAVNELTSSPSLHRGSRMLPNHALHARGPPTMSSGPDRGQAVGTMWRHMTALSPWCGATACAAARQDKTRQDYYPLSRKTKQLKTVSYLRAILNGI